MSDVGPMKWFYCYRQARPPPAAQWVACGPFDTEAEASRGRNRDKADGEVGNVFPAPSKKVADERCNSGFTG